MGLGVLEVGGTDRIPGTVTLLEKRRENNPDVEIVDLRFKHLRRPGKRAILLVPQPSDDPNDPLNWPRWRRDGILVVLSLLAVIATTLSPILAANSLDLAIYFDLPFGKIALLTGYHLLGVGIGGVLCVPSARIWGKRHLYLLGSMILVVSCAWGGASNHNYHSLLWARIFQGIGLAPFEALVNATVGDLFFVHERGIRMALSNLALFGGAFFTPVIVGKMTSSMGWQWSFYFLAIFIGALLPAVVFFIPETAYRRDDALNAQLDAALSRKPESAEDEMSKSRDHASADPESIFAHKEGSSGDDENQIQDASTQKQPMIERVSYPRTLLPFSGRKSDENFFKLLLRPFPLFLHPGIFWACITQGALIGWTVLIGIVLAAIMLSPPLFFTEVQTGYMYSGAFVGALCGFLVSGIIADSSTKFLARINNGVYEPEFKMVLVIPQLIFGCAGLYGFGITTNNAYRYGWVGPVVFFGFEIAGMVCGAVASALYIVDAHRDLAIEGFTCVLIFKNIFSFALTYPGYDWLIQFGPEKIFVIVASVQVGLCALTIPMYIFGKINRAFFARHDLLAMLNLR